LVFLINKFKVNIRGIEMKDGFITEIFKNKLDELLITEQIINESIEILHEKLVTFSGGSKYGQIVFLSGGAGSGKGFASSAFMEANKFKVRDVDEWKKTFLKISQLKNKYPEIRNLDLSVGNDVAALHMFVKKMGIKSKSLELMLNDAKTDRLPNIMFDITGKDMDDFYDVIPLLQQAGYSSKSMHLAWILADYKISYVANVTRERVVPAGIFLGTHKGASKTMTSLINKRKLPTGMDGRFVVVLNNRENTINFKPGETYKGKPIPVNAKGVKGFYYIELKREGKSFKPEDQWEDELQAQIEKNIPGGKASIDRLRKYAIDNLSKDLETADNDDKKEKAKRGIDLVYRDVKNDRIARKLLKSRR
jgi:dephospho-CoA kinase